MAIEICSTLDVWLTLPTPLEGQDPRVPVGIRGTIFSESRFDPFQYQPGSTDRGLQAWVAQEGPKANSFSLVANRQARFPTDRAAVLHHPGGRGGFPEPDERRGMSGPIGAKALEAIIDIRYRIGFRCAAPWKGGSNAQG